MTNDKTHKEEVNVKKLYGKESTLSKEDCIRVSTPDNESAIVFTD